MNSQRTIPIQALARGLLEAYQTRVPIEPLTDSYPQLDVDDAFAILQYQRAHWLAEGRPFVGYKVGLTSAAIQQQMGVDQPDFGYLREDMILDSTVGVNTASYISPRVEPEFAFRLKAPLTGPNLTRDDVMRAIGDVAVSLELIDSRIEGWRIRLVDTIADNASSGGVILGSSPFGAFNELARASVALSVNGVEVATGTGDAVLGDPVNGVLWVANTFGARGHTLEEGSLILSGSITSATPVRAGDEVIADFAGLEKLTVRFT